MSREERRQYQRQMKNMERDAALPPAARARAERNAARRQARRSRTGDTAAFSRRFWIRSGLIAAALGFLVFSVQWGEGMPRALYAGLIAGAVALVLLVGFRLLQRRTAGRS